MISHRFSRNQILLKTIEYDLPILFKKYSDDTETYAENMVIFYLFSLKMFSTLNEIWLILYRYTKDNSTEFILQLLQTSTIHITHLDQIPGSLWYIIHTAIKEAFTKMR